MAIDMLNRSGSATGCLGLTRGERTRHSNPRRCLEALAEQAGPEPTASDIDC